MGELEAWEYLAAYQVLRTQGAGEVVKIKAACEQKHPNRKHILQCRECYPKVVNYIRSTYLEPNDAQWFTGREAFLGDLDALFAAALQYEVKLEDIDARIEAEKRDWYFEQVKASPSIPKTLEELLDRKDLVAKVGSQDVAFEDLVKDMRAALNGGADPQTAQEALARLMAVKTPEDRLPTYKETFFQARPDEPITEKTQIYLEKLQSGATIKEIANKVTSDAAASIGAPSRKELYQKRIQELHRAQAAFQNERSRKADKKPQPPEVPPCNVCRKEVYKESFIGCPYCTILLDAGIRTTTTVWCSQACSGHAGKGFVSLRANRCDKTSLMGVQDAHVDDNHGCAGGEYCVQLLEDDVDMDLDNADDLMCRECTVRLKRESIFCSLRCADLNFQRHREDVHIPERLRREMDADRDLGELIFDDADRSRYHARDIRSHMVAIGNLMRDLKQRKGMNP